MYLKQQSANRTILVVFYPENNLGDDVVENLPYTRFKKICEELQLLSNGNGPELCDLLIVEMEQDKANLFCNSHDAAYMQVWTNGEILDMAAKWWAKGKKPKKIVSRDAEGNVISFKWDRDVDNIPYILFKNANNNCAGGCIKSLDEPITDYTCIGYHFVSEEQKQKVCQMLQEQLGDGYVVDVPDKDNVCIVIYTKQGYEDRQEK